MTTLSQTRCSSISFPVIVPVKVSLGNPLASPRGPADFHGLFPTTTNEIRSPSILPSDSGASPGQLDMWAIPVTWLPSALSSKVIFETILGQVPGSPRKVAFHVPVKSADEALRA